MYDIIPRKDSIILATIDVLNEHGIQGLTIREIAGKAKISEGAIFKHYKSKSDLISAVLDHFSKFDIEIRQTVEMKKMPPKEAIIFTINTYTNYYEGYPAIIAVNEILDELTYDPQLSVKVKNLYLSRVNFFQRLVEEAQAQNEIKPEISSEDVADIIMGLFRAISLKWRFADNSFSLRERMLQATYLVFDAFSK